MVTALLSICMLGERLLPFEIAMMIGAFSGIICLSMGASEEPVEINEDSSMSVFEQEHAYLLGISAALISAISFSFSAVTSRKLRVVHFSIIQFWYAIMACLVMALFFISACISQGHIPYKYASWWIYLELFFTSLFGIMTQTLTIVAN